MSFLLTLLFVIIGNANADDPAEWLRSCDLSLSYRDVNPSFCRKYADYLKLKATPFLEGKDKIDAELKNIDLALLYLHKGCYLINERSDMLFAQNAYDHFSSSDLLIPVLENCRQEGFMLIDRWIIGGLIENKYLDKAAKSFNHVCKLVKDKHNLFNNNKYNNQLNLFCFTTWIAFTSKDNNFKIDHKFALLSRALQVARASGVVKDYENNIVPFCKSYRELVKKVTEISNKYCEGLDSNTCGLSLCGINNKCEPCARCEESKKVLKDNVINECN